MPARWAQERRPRRQRAPATGGVGTDRRTSHANIHFRLGNILEKKGDPAAAQAEYAAARQVYPDFRPDKDTLRD